MKKKKITFWHTQEHCVWPQSNKDNVEGGPQGPLHARTLPWGQRKPCIELLKQGRRTIRFGEVTDHWNDRLRSWIWTGRQEQANFGGNENSKAFKIWCVEDRRTEEREGNRSRNAEGAAFREEFCENSTLMQSFQVLRGSGVQLVGARSWTTWSRCSKAAWSY